MRRRRANGYVRHHGVQREKRSPAAEALADRYSAEVVVGETVTVGGVVVEGGAVVAE